MPFYLKLIVSLLSKKDYREKEIKKRTGEDREYSKNAQDECMQEVEKAR